MPPDSPLSAALPALSVVAELMDASAVSCRLDATQAAGLADGRLRPNRAVWYATDAELVYVEEVQSGPLELSEGLVPRYVADLAGGCALRAVESVRYRGLVVDASGSPVAGAHVDGCLGDEAVTAEDGSFGVAVPLGVYCPIAVLPAGEDLEFGIHEIEVNHRDELADVGALVLARKEAGELDVSGLREESLWFMDSLLGDAEGEFADRMDALQRAADGVRHDRETAAIIDALLQQQVERDGVISELRDAQEELHEANARAEDLLSGMDAPTPRPPAPSPPR